ncbi:probable Putative ATP-dependent RNA helicase YLR419W [Zygosaccharomyces bailii]|nr:probable Putative ATP-dependent RNA helicase YLR419W [Zygosaccharomyces bailii]
MGKKGKAPSKDSAKSSPAPEGLPSGKKKTKGKREELSEDEKSKRQANRAKVTSSSSWTGKLPHTLLHEMCQRRKWNKVDYDMKKIGDKGMLAIAILSYTDPKTKEVLTIRMFDPTYNKISGEGAMAPQETTMEARHLAATVALYRISYNTNLHMMLPPNHKNLWYDLDDFRKSLMIENPHKAKKLFDVDPFKTLVEEQKQLQQKAKNAEAKDRQAEKQQTATVLTSLDLKHRKPETKRKEKTIKKPEHTSKVSFPRRAWEHAAFVDFEESLRQNIESSIRLHINWSSKMINAKDIKSPERNVLKQKLLSLNFRPPHVEEALQYKDPLSFLLFHLPEDDLPAYFHKRKEDSKNILEISALPLEIRNKIDRLTESGISREEAACALENCSMDEAEAAGKLTAAIVPHLVNAAEPFTSERESLEIWDQELESLESMYPEEVQSLKAGSCYTIDIIKEFKIKLKVYRTKNYPSTLPGIIVSTFERNYRLPNYIKQKVLQNLLQYITDSHLLGDMLVFNIYLWLQDHLKEIIENPGPLLSERELLASMKNDEKATSNWSTSNDNRSRRKNHTSNLSAQELASLKKEYSERVITSQYKTMLEARKRLPAWKKQDVIVDLVKSHDVTLITGETGSGKSTQVVQFLLDTLQRENDDFGKTKIICTQPRRISAIGLAERVSDERCVTCGNEVGYVIRGVNKTSSQTRIRFMTTGVLVRILQTDSSFLKNSILLIDEVHERSVDTDLIVVLLKNLMGKIQGLKIVLMSATVNVDVFKNFFNGLGTCHIEGRTFPIKDYFLDDILEIVDFKIRADKFRNYSEYDIDDKNEYIRPGADSKFFRTGQINYDLVCDVVNHVDQELEMKGNNGSVIVFLPGVAEINRCCSMLKEKDDLNRMVVLPLHSALTPEDQKRVFRTYSSKRKVVVSTNIAETSITISDCVATIDTGRAKTMLYNPNDNTTRLAESFISKAEVSQRRGRAGRVREGVSYKLFSKRLYQEDMIAMPIPEIKRVPLESLYISVKSMGIRDVNKFLATGLDPPPMKSLERASGMLATIGLLNEYDNSLTELGRFISLMPVMDSKHGKLLIYSIIFGVTDVGILLASILSIGTMPFLNDVKVRDKVKALLQKFEFRGDLLAVTEILQQYLQLEDTSSKNKFLKEHYLSYNKVKDIMSTRTQFYSILKDVGFIPIKSQAETTRHLNRNSNNVAILKAVLTGAFYPHVARVQLPDPKYMATSVGAIEKDPEAKAIKYWIRNEEYIDRLQERKTNTKLSDDARDELPARRAFIHPSSILFSSNGSPNSEELATLEDVDEANMKKTFGSVTVAKFPFVVFNSSQVTSKLFLREITPTTTLSLLLFGGPISYEVNGSEHSPGIVLDSWLPIRTWCKNGVLIKELRTLLDQAIRDKLENPNYSGTNKNVEKPNAVLSLVERLVHVG